MKAERQEPPRRDAEDIAHELNDVLLSAIEDLAVCAEGFRQCGYARRAAGAEGMARSLLRRRAKAWQPRAA